MSWQASAWAKGQKTGSPSKKAVLLCLGEATDQWGFAWVGGAVIADEAELSLRQVRTLVRELAEQELITIFQGRGKDGVKVNLYRLNFAAKPKDPVPDDHPSLSGRYKHYRGPENLPDLGADLSGGPDAKCDKATGSGASSLVQPTALKPTRTENNRKTRAREADQSEGSASCAPNDEEAETLINAHWRSRREALLRYFAADLLFKIRVGDCVPDSDDGQVLILAVPTLAAGRIMRDAYLTGMETILQREVRFRVTKWAYARREALRVRQRAAS